MRSTRNQLSSIRSRRWRPINAKSSPISKRRSVRWWISASSKSDSEYSSLRPRNSRTTELVSFYVRRREHLHIFANDTRHFGTPCYHVRDEAYSFPGWPPCDIGFAGSHRPSCTFWVAPSLPVDVYRLWGEDVFCHLRIPHHEYSVTRTFPHVLRKFGPILHSSRLPYPARSWRFHPLRMPSLLEGTSLVRHVRRILLLNGFLQKSTTRTCAFVVSGSGGAILLTLAQPAQKILSPQSRHSSRWSFDFAPVPVSLLLPEASSRPLRNLSRCSGHAGHRLPARNLQRQDSENQRLLGFRDVAFNNLDAVLSRHHLRSNPIQPLCALADYVFLHGRSHHTRGADAVSNSEYRTRRVAREDQLQPLFVATAVFLSLVPATNLQAGFRSRSGLSLLLLG